MKKIKGIILAGGTGSRLYPVTKVISKHLIPLYDKPMIYYPLSILKKSKIKDILIISDKINIKLFKKLLGNGKKFKLNFFYKVQNKPNGIPEAFKIGKSFVGKNNVALILGDNIVCSENDKSFTNSAIQNLKKGISTIFGYKVLNPKNYGVVSLDKYNKIKSIVEKPKITNSKIAVIGLYFFTNDVIDKVKNIFPSDRGELEIVDLIKIFLKLKKLKLKVLDKKLKWFDAGTFENILEASKLIALKKNKKK